jgi:CMP-N-acetylneuraminic acid synthetase
MKIFIPIKNNSQRVSRKNFRSFAGEPLYKHTLLKYSQFEVYVDTDSQEIADGILSDERLAHVSVYMRSSDLIGDEISVCRLIERFISKFNIQEPIVQLHVTSPFLSSETIKKAGKMIGEYDSVVACTKYNSRFWKIEGYGPCPVNHNPLKLEQTQDLPSLYEENSAFYIFRPEVVSQTNGRIGQNPYFFTMCHPENIDIDTEDDWNLVKSMEKVY